MVVIKDLETHGLDLLRGTHALAEAAGMEGLSLSLEDKLEITRKLDTLGVHYIEGGYPGSNPKDAEFFTKAKSLDLKHAKLCAFGSTRKPGGDVKSDLRHLSSQSNAFKKLVNTLTCMRRNTHH